MTAGESPLWQISLSTMWAIRNFRSLADFFAAARRLGFSGIELNHQVNGAMLAGLDLAQAPITSVHEPCPADPSVETLKARDWVISATDEENRRQGVAAVRRSIDLAAALGVPVIVVHAGNVTGEWPAERRLYAAWKAGQAGTDDYTGLKAHLEAERAERAGPRLEAVERSLAELLDYARPRRIRLGLENRFHYMDIPTPGELDLLLGLGDPDEIGFWYDVGHAQVLDRLGFFAHGEWTQRFAGRILGVHLHDVSGVDDHDAPGAGDLDFAQIAAALPEAAVRTLEVKPRLAAGQIRQSLELLEQSGCIRRIPA